jgi:hypothetical protein
MRIVDGAVGKIAKSGCGAFFAGVLNMSQSVKIRGDVLTWSMSDAGSGVLTALNAGTGGGGGTLNLRTGETTTSLGERAKCTEKSN